MKRVVVIRTIGDDNITYRAAGDTEFGGAIVNGMVTAQQTEQIRAMQNEIKELRKRDAENGVRVVRDKKYFGEKMLELEPIPTRDKNKAAERILIAWALITLVIREAFRRLDEWVINSQM